jgi:hypothetical protein
MYSRLSFLHLDAARGNILTIPFRYLKVLLFYRVSMKHNLKIIRRKGIWVKTYENEITSFSPFHKRNVKTGKNMINNYFRDLELNQSLTVQGSIYSRKLDKYWLIITVRLVVFLNCPYSIPLSTILNSQCENIFVKRGLWREAILFSKLGKNFHIYTSNSFQTCTFPYVVHFSFLICYRSQM